MTIPRGLSLALALAALPLLTGQSECCSPTPWYYDADGDGYGDPQDVVEACEAPLGYTSNSGDCDDADPLTNPRAAEACDGLDNDCDGLADEPWDMDHDGVASCGSAVVDCNDGDASVYPGAVELCGDRVDQDCDGRTDEGVDLDDDNYGSCASVPDCDDADPAVHPNAAEVCNGKDDDCDGLVDSDDPQGVTTIAYLDGDGDGYGALGSGVVSCPGPGMTTTPGDCDDADPQVNPLAGEVCDGLDNDCDGGADEGLDPRWRPDADGDGFGSEDEVDCAPREGYVTTRGDCDDADPLVHAGAPDSYGDRVDSDCGGSDGPDPHFGLGAGSSTSLAEALTFAPGGTTVWLGPGVYAGEASTILGVDLRVISTHGADQTVIEGGSASLLHVDGGTLTVSGLTLRGASAAQGGGINVVDGALAATDLVLTGNAATGKGGGIALIRSDGACTRCRFEGNQAADGGGVAITGGGLFSLIDVTFADNGATARGGAVYADASAGLIVGSALSGNTAGTTGGAVHLANPFIDPAWGTFSLLGSELRGNRAGTDGGALYLSSSKSVVASPVRLADVDLSGNVAAAKGGAITLASKLEVEIERARFDANLAGDLGGGLYTSSTGATRLTQVTFADNASAQGGGLYTTRLEALTIVNGAFAYDAPDNLASSVERAGTGLSYCAFQGADGPGLTQVSSWADTNLVAGEPGFLTLLADQRPNEDLLLRAGSALKDRGDPAILDPDGSRSDIGAWGGPGADWSAYADTDGDGLLDEWEGRYGLDPTVADAGADADGDGLSNAAELEAATDPSRADTDGDGASDGAEVAGGSNPHDLYSRPGEAFPAPVRVPEDLPTLDAALAAIWTAGHVVLGPGVWGGGQLLVGKALVLEGAGPDATQLDVSEGSVLRVVSGALTLSGVRLSGGRAVLGGGVYLSDSEAALTDVLLEANEATDDGGGLYALRSTVDATQLVVRGNRATDAGGGLYLDTSPTTLAESVIEANSSGGVGGGLGVSRSDLTVDGARIEGNSAGGVGGGLSHKGGGGITLLDLDLLGNTSAGDGGGLYTDTAGDLAIEGLRANGNSAAKQGGGMKITGKTTLVVVDAEVAGNGAGGYGGGLYVGGCPSALFEGMDLVENDSPSYGGGAYFTGSEAWFTDVAVSQNAGGSGGGLYLNTTKLHAGGALVSDNAATSYGGGIAVASGAVLDGAPQISGNRADRGGGASVTGTMRGAFVVGNEARMGGGVLMLYGEIYASWIEDNEATSEGGGIYLEDNDPVVNTSRIIGNRAVAGGGVATDFGGTVQTSFIGGNVASDVGGGILAADYRFYVNQVALVGNLARAGGGLYAYAADLRLRETVVVANSTAGPGGGVYLNAVDPSELEGCIVAQNASTNPTGTQVFVKDSTVKAPYTTVFGAAQGLTADGTTLTGDPRLRFVPAAGQWQGADLHLGLGSPAVNAGRSGLVDLDGSPADQGIYGGALGGEWDKDGDGAPASFLPGGPGDAPLGVDPAAWDEDDWDADVR